MPRFFRNKRVVILAISFVVLVALIVFSLRENRKLTWPEQFTKDAVGLVQSVFQVPAQYVAGFFENVEDIKNTYEENKVLKARLDESASIAAKVKGLEQKNAELQEMVGYKEKERAHDSIPAKVRSRNPDGWYDLLKIDVGEQDGVKEGMAVITSKGLIGRVKSVSKFDSTVQLLSGDNRTNRISAIVRGKENAFGTIEGYDEETQTLLFKRIPSDVPIEEKDQVVTSGLSGLFPEDLLIGEVQKVERDEFGLDQIAYVKPAADFMGINHVFVVKGKGEDKE
jgi:rod shape-determining protein MreC